MRTRKRSFNQQAETEGEWKAQNIGRAVKRGSVQAWKSRCWSQPT